MWRRIADLCGLNAPAREDILIKRKFPNFLDLDVPVFSLPKSRKQLDIIMDALIREFGEEVIARVPGMNVQCKECTAGFVASDDVCQTCGGRGRHSPKLWSASGQRNDYVLVACDERGRARWGTRRRLPYDPTSDKKYVLLSSSRAGEASLSGLPKYHVAGRHHPRQRVFITEGILKAEIIADQLRCPVIGIYSTSVDDPTLIEVRRVLQEWRLREVVVAFDADKHETHADGKPIRSNVLKGEQKLVDAFQSDFDVFSAEWELRDGKGLDDLLVAGGSYTVVDRYKPPVPRARVPRPCAAPPEPRFRGTTLAAARKKTFDLIARGINGKRKRFVDVVSPPPGTAKTGSVLRAMETSSCRVMIAVSRHDQAEEIVARAASEDCQCGKRRGDCPDQRLVIHHDRGRSAENCANYELVREAIKAGYGPGVGTIVCGSEARPKCSYFASCPYQGQFQLPGSHVAPVELVTQRIPSTRDCSVVVFDDIDSARLISNTTVTLEMLESGLANARARGLHSLLDIITKSVRQASSEGAAHRDAFELLNYAALQKGTTLEAILKQTPAAPRFAPQPTIDGFRTAVPGQLSELVAVLQEENPWYLSGEPFTSGLRITNTGIHITRLLKPMARGDGVTALAGKSVLVLSATPDPVLRRWLDELGLKKGENYRPAVLLPEAVRVVQDVSGFFGKGSTQRNDRATLIERAREYVAEFSPRRLGVVTHKHMREEVAVGLGLTPDQVLYFGNMRGANELRDVDLLLVIGTPAMSTDDAYRMACAAGRGPTAPPSDHLCMRQRRYEGWQDEAGLAREVEVQEFRERYVTEIYEMARRDELVQAIYRCRPFDLDTSSSERSSLTIALLTEQPIAGITVEDMRFGGNAQRSEAARAKHVA